MNKAKRGNINGGGKGGGHEQLPTLLPPYYLLPLKKYNSWYIATKELYSNRGKRWGGLVRRIATHFFNRLSSTVEAATNRRGFNGR